MTTDAHHERQPPLVLVVLGTGHHPFTRLVGWADAYAADHPRVRVTVLRGQSPAPAVAHGRTHVDRDELRTLLRRATVVVTHGGAATIAEARRAGHRPIVVARDPELGEHLDDHQLRLVARLDGSGMVRSCASLQQLTVTLDKALAQPGDFRLDSGAQESATAVARHAGSLIDLLAPAPPGDQPLPKPRRAPPDRWPDVTVVVASDGHADHLRDTVRRVTAQDYPGVVVTHVVHDGDTPDHALADHTRSRPVRVLRNAMSPGLAGARNTGVLVARSELVAFCAAGDTWFPHKLRRQVEVLRAEPETEAVCCGTSATGDPRETTARHTGLTFADLLTLSSTGEVPHPSTLVFRRHALVHGCGMLSQTAPVGCGAHYDLLLRLARRATVRAIPEPGARVRAPAQPRGPEQWQAVASSLRWLCARYPEFRLVPNGLAKLSARIAFAEAASGRRGAALEWGLAAVRARPTEPRAYLALAVASGMPVRVARRALRGSA